MNLDSIIPSRASQVGKTPHYLLISLKTARTTQIHKDGQFVRTRGREEAEVTARGSKCLWVCPSVGLLRGSDSGRNLFTWGVTGMWDVCAGVCTVKSSLTRPPCFLKWRSLSGTWQPEILLSLSQRNTTPRCVTSVALRPWHLTT